MERIQGMHGEPKEPGQSKARRDGQGWAGPRCSHPGNLGSDWGKIRVRLRREQRGTWEGSGGDGATLI